MINLSQKDLENVNGGVVWFPAFAAGYFVGQAAAMLINKLQ